MLNIVNVMWLNLIFHGVVLGIELIIKKSQEQCLAHNKP